MSSKESYTENVFPLLDLPILVLEKVLSYMTDLFDIKSVRRTCKDFKHIMDKNPEALIKLKVTPLDLNGLGNLVQNGSRVHWNNIHFPPELYHVGCRRHYVEQFNSLLVSFADMFAPRIRILELNHLNFSNVNYVNLIKQCQQLEILKVDTMIVKGMKEKDLQQILEDESVTCVLKNLNHLDVTAFEFLTEEYQFTFMGQLLEKCSNLTSIGSWGYFPEWEQPAVGGTTHLKYFLWPLLTYLRSRFEIVDLMLQDIHRPSDISQLNSQYINESMDWQSSKWILDLRRDVPSDHSSLEKFIYSKISSYVHRAVGWFDEGDYRKSGLSLMTNLSTIHIHNARDIKLTGENPYTGRLFPKLENLTLIVGSHKPHEEDEQVLLGKVIVDMLLNIYRPTVKNLTLDIDLNHHHQYSTIDLPSVIRNFPSLTSLCVEEWGPSDEQMLTVFEAFPSLQSLMFCGRNLSDLGILGSLDEAVLTSSNTGIRKLKYLQILKLFSVRLPPKNVFPWPTKENNRITDFSFRWGFSKMRLRKFYFLLKSDLISKSGLEYLRDDDFSKSIVEFVMNWLPNGVKTAHEFNQLHVNFKFLDPQTFLEPANFVIPDIGNWIL